MFEVGVLIRDRQNLISNLYVTAFNSPYYRDAVVPLFIEFERAFSSAVEHRTFNPQVVGSIPTGPTKLDL